jgi:Ca-activated chloride channel family protein
MSTASRLIVSVSVLAILVPISGPAFAAPKISDGKPTPAACEQLGFSIQTREEEYGGSYAAPTVMPAPAPQEEVAYDMVAPPAPPPMAGAVPPPEFAIAASQAAKRSAMGGSSYSIPPQIGVSQDTERYPNAVQNPVKRVAADPVSTFSIDVDTASYANVRRFLNGGQLPPSDAVRVEELVNYFDYGYQKPESAAVPFRASTTLVPSPWSKDRQILHVGLQGYDIPQGKEPPLNLVLLVDTSGSMQDQDRLPLAKKALNILIDQLDAKDHVSIVAYAGSAGAVLAPTSGNQKLKIRCALEALDAGGSTAGGEGLALAYNLGKQSYEKSSVNRVILLTDGDFNVGISDPEKLKDFIGEQRKSGIYLSVYGFGRGNYNDVMMQGLAQTGNGTASYIDTLDEARKLLRDDLSGSLFPIADDVKIQIEFNSAHVSEYRLIGYETRLLNREDFNNDKVDAGEVGSGASVTALYEITPTGAKPSSDALRYGEKPVIPAKGGELGFLKIRYKLPGQTESKLIEQPISPNQTAHSAAEAPEATRWAISVAAFGERLRSSPWIADSFGWKEIRTMAQASRGQDEFGLRAEFVKLIRAAETAKSVNE